MEDAEVCKRLNDTLASGSDKEKIQVASKTDIPDSCSCDIFLKLSEDKSDDVRLETAKNTNIPDACMCRIAGRLNKDKNLHVIGNISKNQNARESCKIQKDINCKFEQWNDFDAKKATIDCFNSYCENPDRIIGEMEAQDVDIVSIKNPHNQEERDKLERKGFVFAPEKVLWYKYTPKTLDEYLSSIKKGKYIKKNLRKLEEKGIKFKYDIGTKDMKLLDDWYKLYEESVINRERGIKRVSKKNLQERSDMNALYMFDKDDELLAGIMLQEGKSNQKGTYNSAAYGAFSRKYPGITDVMYYKLIERAIEKDMKATNLGIDTNFYGYQLKNTLYKFKNSVGFTPRPYRIKNYHHLKVINPDKFDNPFCFIETDFKTHSKAINNVFLRGDERIRMENYNAKDGMKLYLDDKLKKTTYFQPKHNDFFPDILDENILGV